MFLFNKSEILFLKLETDYKNLFALQVFRGLSICFKLLAFFKNKPKTMSNVQPRINKVSLVNTLVQTELHNRMQEEQLMWRKHKKLKQKRDKTDSYDTDSGSEEQRRKHKKKKRHKDKVGSPALKRSRLSADHTAQQEKIISSGEKWGHDGFMEIHPEAVISGNCFNSPNALNNTISSNNDKKRSKKKLKKNKVKKTLSCSSDSDSLNIKVSKKSKKHKSKSCKLKKKR